MDKEFIATFADAARVCGYPDASAFAREMMAAMISADPLDRINFAMRLTDKMGEQLTLPLAPVPAPRKGTKPKVRGKGAKKRGRT